MPLARIPYLVFCETNYHDYSVYSRPLSNFYLLGLLMRICFRTSHCFLFTCQSWPDDALQVVAQRFLEELEMEPQVKSGCVQMCKTFHTGTRQLSKSFLDELKRHNYVTPTSYLELISTFKSLLNMKQV